MRLTRFFIDNPLTLGRYQLPDDRAHYAARVLRLGQGDAIQLFDGSGEEYLGVIAECGKRQVWVELQEKRPGLPESPLRVHLGQVLSKGERMDWVMQKATELGVSEITPLFSERCEVRLNEERSEKRMSHWQQVVVSACEQCGRSRLPTIHPPMPLALWRDSLQADLKLLLHPGAGSLRQASPPKTLALLVGPEGGLSAAEVAAAEAAGFLGIRLGPRVLRTETAPLAALSVVQHLWGDFDAR